MYCRDCGTEIKNTDHFCFRCGLNVKQNESHTISTGPNSINVGVGTKNTININSQQSDIIRTPIEENYRKKIFISTGKMGLFGLFNTILGFAGSIVSILGFLGFQVPLKNLIKSFPYINIIFIVLLIIGLFASITSLELHKRGFFRIPTLFGRGINFRTDKYNNIYLVKYTGKCSSPNCTGNIKIVTQKDKTMWVCDRNWDHKFRFDYTLF